jgi:hypothetical protein
VLVGLTVFAGGFDLLLPADRVFKGVFDAAALELAFFARLFFAAEVGVEFFVAVSAAFLATVTGFERPLFDLSGGVPDVAVSPERDLGSARLLPGPDAIRRGCATVLPFVLEFVSVPA